MAETLTSKLKLAKHDTGDLNWGADANANMDALDQLVQQAVLRPPRTLLATLGSGAAGANLLGGTTYFYKVTAVNAVGETTEGQIPAVVEAQVTQPATPLPVILQWETVAGATGYKIYKSTASGQEQFLAQVAGQATSTYTDTGGTATTAAAVPTSNTARTSVSQILAGANVTVTPPDGTGAVTIAAVGGGPSGYATAVVAAPSGSAATDTSNVQNAINAVSAKGGGSVILREGTYLIDATITLASNVAILGQGRNATVLQASGLGAVSMLLANSGQSHVQIKYLTIDMNFPVRGAQNIPSGGADVQIGPNVGFGNVLEDVLFKNGTSVNEHILWDSGSVINCEFYFNGATGGALLVTSAGQITDCYFNIGGANLANTVAAIVCQGEGCIIGNVVEIIVGTGNTIPTVISLASPGVVGGNTFRYISGGATTAIFIPGTSGKAAVVGNSSDYTANGNISTASASVIVAGNSGFASYVGGTQSGNDGQNPVNSGSAAGGDLSGTYPNPTVAKVNGTSVPAAPAAGQVLTATGPSAAAWQAPAAGSTPGYPSILGNGSDGDAVIAANTQLAATGNFGAVQVAVKNYKSLTINAGAVLSPAPGVVGIIIRCQGTVTINGAINADAAAGNGGGTSSPGGPGLGILDYAAPSPALVPTLGPAAGGTGTYPGSPSGSGIISCGGGGGGYGYGGTDNGGAGGPAASAGLVALFQKIPLRVYEACFLAGSGGGTNGGGGQASGAAVSGGGFVLIFANSIVIGSTGLVSANGGSANQTLTFAQGSGVGNGGGGGGFILLAYNGLSNAGTVEANGGQGGPAENESQALTPGPAGGASATINGTPAAGTAGGGSNFFGAGGSGAGGIIIGVQIPA